MCVGDGIETKLGKTDTVAAAGNLKNESAENAKAFLRQKQLSKTIGYSDSLLNLKNKIGG